MANYGSSQPRSCRTAPPKAFSVPVLTVMELKGDKIDYDGDLYNYLEVIKQSGLPTN